MSNLPKGWANCSIGEITQVIAGGTPPSKDNANFQEKGGVAWITPADLSGYKGMYISHGTRNLSEIGYKASSARKMPAGTVLFSSRAPIGYVAIAKNEISTNQGFKNFVLPNGLESRFVYYYLRHIKPLAESVATGTTFKELSGSAAAKLPILVAPRPEQKRIADKLDTVLARVDACRERLNRVPFILKRFRQSVLASATSGQLTADWRKQNGGWVDERNSTIAYDAKHDLRVGCEQSVLPNGWVKETLAKVIHLDLGYAFKSADFQKKGVRLLRGDNIEPGKLRWNEPAFYDPSRLGGCQHLLLNAGDVVLAMDRPIITKGLKIARVHADDVPCVLVQRVCRFIPTDRISADYLYQTLCDNAFIGYLQGAQNGTQIPHISGKQILSFEVPIPPVAEQHEIVRRVETLFAFADRLEVRLTTARTATDRLTPALLAKAFRGELVPQDPNDEPAVELLKHVAAARTVTSDKPRRGRAAKAEKRPSGHPSQVCDS